MWGGGVEDEFHGQTDFKVYIKLYALLKIQKNIFKTVLKNF